ncbi:aldehyde dehydrogenase family protein [Pseudomonas sp. Pseusp122]|uniref:aldehyde dehydrogenase family protein n=1 Tax=unclassified Pseudomonas TaxID=196821 RepID=UPI0039A70FE6
MSAVIDLAHSSRLFDGPYYLSIAGKLVESQASFDVMNPATGQVLAQAAVAVANRLETGMVWVNEMYTQGVDIPFGGHKQSGVGTEGGHEGRLLFTNPKAVLIKK